MRFVVLLLLIVLSFGAVCADETPTAQFTLVNSVPLVNSVTVSTVETGIVNSVTNPTNVGQTVNFSVEWFDANTEPVKVLVCKNDDATATGCGSGGTWAESASFIQDKPESVYHQIAVSESQELYQAYVYVTDGENVSASSTVTFNVNHQPEATDVHITPATAYTDTQMSCDYTFTDPDTGDTENVTGAVYRWYIQNESSGSFDAVAGETGKTLDNSYFDESDVVRCDVMVQDMHGFSDDAYVVSDNVTVLNRQPIGVSGYTDANTACAKDVGETVTFSVDYTDLDQADAENEPVRIFVCTSSPCDTTSTTIGGSCTGTQSTNDGSTIQCSYTLQNSDVSGVWYVAACDDNDACTQDSVQVYVNHAPTVSGVVISPASPYSNQNLTCNYAFNDGDGGSDTSTFRWWRNTGSGWVEDSSVGMVLPYNQTRKDEQWVCSVVPKDQCDFVGQAVNSSSVTILNVAPEKPSDLMVRDGPDSWDGVDISTHDKLVDLNWTVGDFDGDSVSTHVCISSVQSNLDSWTCDYSVMTSDHYLNDVPGLWYNGTSMTYYVRLIPTDGTENGTLLDAQFDITNSIPNTPNLLSPIEYHTQTPTFTWSVSDPDNGSVDHWPADTVTSHIRIGSSCGLGDYHSNDAANPAGELSSVIPWGTPGSVWANTTACVTLWATDGNGGVSSNYSLFTTLYDYLPDVVDVQMTNNGGTYSSCTSATCVLNPIMHSNTTVAAKVTIYDTDNDCDAEAETSLYLCLAGTCDVASAEYTYQLDNVKKVGSTCTFTFSANQTENTPQFFREPNTSYALFVNATSQGGMRATDPERTAAWQYGALSAIDYPSVVYMGDNSIDLNQWNNGTSLARLTNWGNTLLDLAWNSSNPTNGDDTWVLNGTDMQLDDDPVYGDESSGALSPIALDHTLRGFNPVGGLALCTSFDCDDPTVEETLDTYYHIFPPYGLKKGTYNSTITIVISTH